MLCLASNLAHTRTTALGLPVWRYRFDHVASNLNSRGVRIGAFHGSDIRFVMGQWRLIVLYPPFVAATPEQVIISDIMLQAWTNFIKGDFCQTLPPTTFISCRPNERSNDSWLESL
jgi:carboxylesterase type B